MSSTLIVRDAVSVVLGERDPDIPLGDHLRDLTATTARLKGRQAEECLDVLASSGGGDDSDPEILAAVMVLALAQRRMAQERGINPVVYGRRLANHLERDGDADGARTTLEILAEHLPQNRAIERALGKLMRRQGMVEELVERNLARASSLLAQGHGQEAVPFLREVLLLDRTRKDVARTIRDLRFDEVEQRKRAKRRKRLMVAATFVSLLVFLVAFREVKVRSEYQGLPAMTHGDLNSMRSRLAALEAFIDGNPIWHGSLHALRARSELRIEIDRINDTVLMRREMRAENARRKARQAENEQQKGLRAADAEEFEQALQHFHRALELAAEGWPQRSRVQRDIAAIEKFLGESR